MTEATPAPKAPAPNGPGLIDRYIGKFVSRKLVVFGVATAALYFGKLGGDQWAYVATAYIGGNAVIGVAKAWRYGR